MSEKSVLVSVIVPIYNGSKWIKRCFESILKQTAVEGLNLEICVCNDASTDNTLFLLKEWKRIFNDKHIELKIVTNEGPLPCGVGFSKNKAVSISEGEYLCFHDIDDVMLPDRILLQYKEISKHLSEDISNLIVGCEFKREPEDSTKRYTNWANSLTKEQLNIQIFTSNGPTVIMPTWFCHRRVFERIGGFSNEKNVPEDLIFFYKHLDFGGKVVRVNQCLLIYTYHLNQTTFNINENLIWNLRIERLEKVILNHWETFTIWNAGKQGRKLYNSICEKNRKKVKAFCDVDLNKIGKFYQYYDPVRRKCDDNKLEIVHFRNAQPPFVICVKMDMTEGSFETNLDSLNLKEGIDYIMFS